MNKNQFYANFINMDNKLKLSIKRTNLANMRTLLSYVRTSVGSLSVAFALIKLDKSKPFDIFTLILFIISAFFLIAGGVHYYCNIKAIEKSTENEED